MHSHNNPIIEFVRGFAKQTGRDVEDVKIYFRVARLEDYWLVLALQAIGAHVTAPNPLEGEIAVAPPDVAHIMIVYRARDFHPICFPWGLKAIVTLNVPISTTLENMLAARAIYCFHAPNLRLAGGPGAVEQHVQALLQQVDQPDTMKMLSEVLTPMYQGWKEAALMARKVPSDSTKEGSMEEIRIFHRMPPSHHCRLYGKCNLPEGQGPDFLIQRQGKPIELISLVQLQAIIASVWAVWVDGRLANLKALQDLLICRQPDCPYAGTLAAEEKEAA